MLKVSVLYARRDSIYRDLCFDVWDESRDARLYSGPWPVVAHPPCRAWGPMRQFANPPEGEAQLAFDALDKVRRFGGILEHPQGSDFWRAASLPRPSDAPDRFGGFTVLIDQGWFGHFAPKPTWLHVVGMPRHHFPPMPVDQLARRTGRTKAMQPADRERTPWHLAAFLLRAAAQCRKPVTVRPGRT